MPQAYVRANKIDKKIVQEHKNLMETSEIDAKVKYVKLARGLPTFGVHFFLVKVRMNFLSSGDVIKKLIRKIRKEQFLSQ